MSVFETSRLMLREMTPGDAENAYLLNLDHEVVQYTGDAPFESIDAARTFLENYEDYRKNGYGRWAVIRKEDNAWMGWCGLKYLADKEETDLGYRLMKKYWNLGYATEAAKACVDFGFEKLGLSRIIGQAMAANAASIKVLQKAGLKFFGNDECGGQPGLVYHIYKEDWEQQKIDGSSFQTISSHYSKSA